MRYAIIKDGKVENVIEADQEFAKSIGAILAGSSSIGDLFAEGVFTKPPALPPVTPQSVTMRQARLALLGAGLLDAVQTAITSAGPAAKIEWEYAAEVQRSSGLVPAMATALGMTAAQIDALFIAAAAI